MCNLTFGSSWKRGPSFNIVTNTITAEAIPAICNNHRKAFKGFVQYQYFNRQIDVTLDRKRSKHLLVP